MRHRPIPLLNRLVTYVRRHIVKWAAIVASLCVALIMVHGQAAAAGRVHEINSVADFITVILASRGDNGSQFEGETVRLNVDLDLSTDDVDNIISQIGSLTFGTIDRPFKGEFDGAGHTITGLDYQRDLWVPAANTGLFAATDGAYIHDINFRDGYVGADFRGGYIVGYAKNSAIADVKITNCTSSVTPANNAVSLITNAGLAGGMIAGQTEGGVIYNCEVSGGSVVNNSTAGVSGLGGEGLYLGAIVGTAKGTTIEYCRVTPLRDPDTGVYILDDAGAYRYTSVKNSYDIAVGAVSGQAVYAGGIAGSIYDGAQVLDCFSTADCYAYSATYVSVGAGNASYVGGIAARADGGAGLECTIARSHYAGNIHSRQYNAVLVIPIIQNDVNIAGIVERDDDGDVRVYDSYFKPSASATTKTINAVGDNASGLTYGPLDDARYANRSFWESKNYDFEGDAVRDTAYTTVGGAHVNKWIMDFNLGIPVHGASVKATFDFPGAATVTVSPTGAAPSGSEQSTSDPYSFAVQGVLPSDTELGLTAVINDGFRLVGWYREPSVEPNYAENSHAFFDPIVSDPAKQVGTDATYTARNSGTGAYDGFADNDLFVAYCQARVVYHDVTGAAIAASTDDWYDHQEPLPDVAAPAADKTTGGVDASAEFVGWTTIPSSTGAGYAAITSPELASIKAQGELYQAGDPVEKPMDLYPVYTSYASNINLVVEGNELDGDVRANVRTDVAEAQVVATKVNGKNTYSIVVSGADETSTVDALPYGYRFKGWYKVAEDGAETKVSNEETYAIPDAIDLSVPHTYIARFEYRVNFWLPVEGSDNFAFLATSTRLATYAYTGFYSSEWGSYQDDLADIASSVPKPSSMKLTFEFLGWTNHADLSKDSNGEVRIGRSVLDDYPAIAGVLTAPVNADALLKDSIALYDPLIVSDFPGSSSSLGITTDGALYNVEGDILYGYNFVGLTRVITGGSLASDVSYGPSTNYVEWQSPVWFKWKDRITMGADHGQNYIFKASANINFYNLSGALIEGVSGLNDTYVNPGGWADAATATRKYQSPLFNGAGETLAEVSPYNYVEPIDIAQSKVPVGLGTISPDILPAEGALYSDGTTTYSFMGWVCPEDLTADEMARAFKAERLGTAGYVASSVADASPYLLRADDRVYHAMDIYPVYAAYSFDTTTNIARAGVPASSSVNVPADPAAVLQDASHDAKTGDITLAVTANVDTPLAAGSADLYQVTSWTVERSDGYVETINTVGGSAVSNTNNVLDYTVSPAYGYTFVANYEPVAVVYHTNAGVTEVVARNLGDALGEPAKAAFDVDAIDAAHSDAGATRLHVLVGWTELAPGAAGRDYVLWGDYAGGVELTGPNAVVEGAMELWPVYRPATVSVNSNIDDELAGGLLGQMGLSELTDVRSLVRVDTQGSSTALVARAADVPGYRFVGWYDDYDAATGAGVLVTTGSAYGLMPEEPFGTNMFTAVYEPVFDVRYHMPDGEVHTVKVAASEQRSFVESVTDESGTHDNIIDWLPYQIIADKLNASPDTSVREMFSSWSALAADGTTLRAWDEFCRETIVGDMDLYPVTYQMRAFDATYDAAAPAASNYTANMAWMVSQTDVNEPVKVAFTGLYTQDELRVSVVEAAYGPGSVGAGAAEGPTFTPIVGVGVGLYDHAGVGGSAQKLGHKATDAQGFAIFALDGAGTLTLTKTAPAEAAGSTCTFEIVACSDAAGNEVAGAERRVVTMTLGAPAAGETLSSATMSVRMPFGYYKVIETGWAWRYLPSYRVLDGATGTWAEGNCALVFTTGEVRVDNAVENDAWVDGEARVENVFGAGAVRGGA